MLGYLSCDARSLHQAVEIQYTPPYDLCNVVSVYIVYMSSLKRSRSRTRRICAWD